MGKGAQTSTQTTINPGQQAQAPFLLQGWQGAQNLYNQNQAGLTPYSSVAPTLATWGQPQRIQSYNDLYNTGQNVQGLNPQVQNAYGNVLGASGASNPAWGGYQDFAQGTAGPGAGYETMALNAANTFSNRVGGAANPTLDYAGQAAANNNLGLSQLGNTASGATLNANPYINAAIQAAQRPVTENYQTSIAPSMDAALASSGRYGSGAQAGLYGQAQGKLAQGLGDISSNMMNANYARERTAQDAAAQQYGTLYNAGLGLGMQGMRNVADIGVQAGGQYAQGLTAANQAAQQRAANQQSGLAGLAGLWNQGTANQLSALQQFPQLAAGMGTGSRMGVEATTGLAGVQQAQINADMQRWQEAQNAPYDALNRYMQSIGTPVGGSETKQTPYYNNPIAGIGSLLSGVAGVATAFSDRRLKEDDQVVGQIGDVPIHTFKYKGDATPRIGFMADEVDPKAVIDHPSGYKAVNYDTALTSALNSFRKR
jgi:hypothetical protein